ncbi:Gx transporter family protein [Streptococcus ictaluri]|uniref:Heptaprenyl diphosphate synthase component I n=1 Tax=Streptococcus ictaluri 707-05 TaxID=764299 RepID=G5K389_9STRE|nr:Gx transporter family protein [Streptococcus ictaluri]EHI69924.1 heptaprenyl diphosphate synthase component I [Streptococcus ictaluri 707-05]
MTKNHQKILFITMLAAQAVVISFYERFIPTPFAFAPGARLGLSNLITILAIFTLKPIDSVKVVLLKLSIATFLSGTFSTFLYGFSGTVLSFVMMLVLKKLGSQRVSVIGISTLGGVMHNLGQLLVFAFIARSWLVLNYLPILSFSGIVSGFFVGLTGNYLLIKVRPLHQFHHDLLDDWTFDHN